MPMATPMTLALTDGQLEAMRRIARKHCTRADVELALARYPGRLDASSTVPVGTQTMEQILTYCVSVIADENAYYAHSFALRLIEQTWAAEPVRQGVAEELPSLVRPPRGLRTQVDSVAAGLAALAQRLPAAPSMTDLGDPATYRRICVARADLAAAAAALAQFGMLKGLHDALHLLQVLGATALDILPSHMPRPSAPLPVLLRAVLAAATDAPADVSTRVCGTVTDAERRIATGNANEAAFAHAELTAMLVRELPILDQALFDTSREFPLRGFHRIFDDDDLVRHAAIDLGDTLRRRLMEHGLWQATDSRLYALEQALLGPSPLERLSAGLLPFTTFNLRVLLDPTVVKQVVAPMNDAFLRYAMATDPTVPPGQVMGSLEEVRHRFADMRDAARSAFLAVDKALMEDFGLLLALEPGLRDLLFRVPAWCGVVLETLPG